MLKYEIIDVFCVKYIFKPKNVVTLGTKSTRSWRHFRPQTPYRGFALEPTGGLPSPYPLFCGLKESL